MCEMRHCLHPFIHSSIQPTHTCTLMSVSPQVPSLFVRGHRAGNKPSAGTVSHISDICCWNVPVQPERSVTKPLWDVRGFNCANWEDVHLKKDTFTLQISEDTERFWVMSCDLRRPCWSTAHSVTAMKIPSVTQVKHTGSWAAPVAMTTNSYQEVTSMTEQTEYLSKTAAHKDIIQKDALYLHK